MFHSQADVIVIGGSAAGLFSAWRLAESGARVAVLERNWRLGEPTRTLIVTPELGRLLGEEPTPAIRHRVQTIHLASPGASTSVRLGEADWVVDRASIIDLLAERALRAGADLRRSTTFVGFEADGAKVVVHAVDGAGRRTRLSARAVIGADGARSRVARAVGAGLPPAVPIVQAVVRLPVGQDPSQVRVWFDRRLTSYFLWLIPDGPETGVLGLVGEPSSRARNTLDGFIRRHGYQALGYQGAVIPLHQPFRQLEYRLGSGRVLLVGDAAGHVKVTTVGGLVSGLMGARAAAEALARNLSYRRALRPVDREIYLHDVLRGVLSRFSNHDYDALIGGLNDRTRTLLLRCSRDQIAPGAFELLRGQPGLMFLAARAVARTRRARDLRGTADRPLLDERHPATPR